jgi:alpha,alpha-trehalase
VTSNPFRPVEPIDGYLPIEDHGLIGDGRTAGLVARDASIDWLCVPRFDSPPLFARILDRHRGGAFSLLPEELVESRQAYLEDSGVLVTELRTRTGLVQVTDALVFRSGADLAEDATAARGELVRSARCVAGNVRLQVSIEPRGEVRAEPRGTGIHLIVPEQPDLDLQLTAVPRLPGLGGTVELAEGERLDLVLRWVGQSGVLRMPEVDALLEETANSWRRWARRIDYDGPHPEHVRRSGITLKMLDHFENGAIVAAPTSSLPEAIGGPRNWDYRFAWVRDVAFSVYALRRIGLSHEAWGFLSWVLGATENDPRPAVLYDLDGRQPPPEWEDPDLEGYRRSPPVRWGNGAAEQTQNDVFGELVDCAYQWVRGGGELPPELWERLRGFIEKARTVWHEPDHGIWEVRTPGRVFTYSASICHVALDRGARLAERLGLPGDVDGWRREADRIRDAILTESWSPERQSLTEHLGGGGDGGLDAGLLTLPLRRVIPADHPAMVATTKAVVDRLGAGDGLVYRYLPDESPDGLPGHEGAFLLCSFWLVDNYALQGRLDEAMALYDSLVARVNPLGLLPEQIDPESGAFLGNFPQAFSHVGLVSSGVTLGRRLRELRG